MRKPFTADDTPPEVHDAMIRPGFRRLQEFPGKGFEAFVSYDAGFLRDHARRGYAFFLQTFGSREKYGIAIVRGTTITDTQCHAVWVGHNGEWRERKDWRALTLLRGKRGQIIVKPGWL